MQHIQRGLGLLLATVLGIVALDACAARTSGVKLTFQAKVVGSLTNGKAVSDFKNRRGWKIELQKAYMLFGPMYLLEGPPQASLWDYFRLSQVAYAHVNANGQRVLGELRKHHVVDLLTPTPTSVGTMRGITGLAETAELHLLPAGSNRLAKDSAPLSQVNGATIHAEGKATKGAESRQFRLKLTFPKRDRMQLVTNISTEVSLREGQTDGGQLLVRVYVDRWFTNVDFATLTNKDKQGRFLLSFDNNAVTQGVRSRHSYNFSWRSK